MNWQKLQLKTPAQVETLAESGLITEDMAEHYFYHWRNSAYRFGNEKRQYETDKCPVCGEVFSTRRRVK